MSVSIDLLYNHSKDTYKIFLKPNTKSSGDLGVRNFARMLVADKKHHDLFGKNVTTTNLPDGYEHYTITSIQGLFDKICNSAPNVTFTYCYKPDGRLYLCKTNGKEDDAKCKHAWLCNKIRGILAAGVIQFSKKDDTGIIYIDNMSGTYKTQPYNLEIFKKDFENSFPGINIELITSPNINTESRNKYCTVMTNASPDYDTLCDLSTSDEDELSTSDEGLVSENEGELSTSGQGELSTSGQDESSTSGGRNKKSNKKSNKRTNKKTNKRTNKKSNKKSNKRTNKKSNKRTNKKSNKKLNKRTNKKTNKK